jgi:hypothetical protein
MGQIARQVTANTTRYYWYPGERRDWSRAAISLALGAVVYGVVATMTDGPLVPVTVGASVTTLIAGFNFGRRDACGFATFPDLTVKAARRSAVGHAGRAAWRGLVEGVGGAGLAVLIINLPPHGFVANWVLPLVPPVVGALAHQAGLLYERTGHSVVPTTFKSFSASADGVPGAAL